MMAIAVGLMLAVPIWAAAWWVWGLTGVVVFGLCSSVLGACVWMLSLSSRETKRVQAVKIEPRLSFRGSALAEMGGETRSHVVSEPVGRGETETTAYLDRLIASGASGDEIKARMGTFTQACPPSIVVPGPVSRETLDRVRDAFAPSNPDNVWDAKIMGLQINIRAAEEARAAAERVTGTYDRAMALAARVTPELLAQPIPTPARLVLEELASLAEPDETGEMA